MRLSWHQHAPSTQAGSHSSQGLGTFIPSHPHPQRTCPSEILLLKVLPCTCTLPWPHLPSPLHTHNSQPLSRWLTVSLSNSELWLPEDLGPSPSYSPLCLQPEILQVLKTPCCARKEYFHFPTCFQVDTKWTVLKIKRDIRSKPMSL